MSSACALSLEILSQVTKAGGIKIIPIATQATLVLPATFSETLFPIAANKTPRAGRPNIEANNSNIPRPNPSNSFCPLNGLLRAQTMKYKAGSREPIESLNPF